MKQKTYVFLLDEGEISSEGRMETGQGENLKEAWINMVCKEHRIWLADNHNEENEYPLEEHSDSLLGELENVINVEHSNAHIQRFSRASVLPVIEKINWEGITWQK